MFRKLAVAALILMLLFGSVQTATAVKNGTADNNEHPYVGLIVFYDATGAAQWRCTGTLISPTVVLTAGHCAELEEGARIYFEENVGAVDGYPYSGGYTGTAYVYQGWQGGLYLPDTGDVGVVVLDEPITWAAGMDLPTLAPVGYLDDLATARGTKNVNFEVVGYGLQSVKPTLSSLRVRLKAWVQLVNLRSALTDGYNLHTTSAPGKGTGGGGTCFGDSGGPIFSVVNGEHLIVAVNSFVLNENCAGASFGYRVDTQGAYDWVMDFVN